MSDKETRKRLVILLISLFGIAVIIGLYAWVWFDFYHPFFLRWEDIKLYRRVHILIPVSYTHLGRAPASARPSPEGFPARFGRPEEIPGSRAGRKGG